MFQTQVKSSKSRSAFFILELMYHATVRQLRQSHRSAVIGLLMNMMQMVIFILAFVLLFQMLGMRSAAVRGDFLLYIMSGIFVYMTHIKSVSAVMGSEGPTSAMMQHAPMNTAIAISASALSTLYIQVLSLVLILTVYHIAFVPITIDQPVAAMGMVLLSWFSGCAVGMVLLAIKPWAPTLVSVIQTIYIRANMIASGKMFLANSLPAHMLAMFDWNPLFHIIDQARGFIFLHYNPHFSNIPYPIYVALTLLMIGLMGEFYTRRNASTSWNAAR
ncbi:ABC transporter permease [Loktanella agnita]|uniref:ABC transporter permease n=1 Tax=Loktanella agnita TaxID=287097 RepID=UPI00398739D1